MAGGVHPVQTHLNLVQTNPETPSPSQKADPIDVAAMKEIHERMNAGGQVRVLELGTAADGGIGRFFANAGAETVSVAPEDFSASFNSFGLPNLYFCKGELDASESWGLPSFDFDLVFADDSLHFLTFWDAMQLLNKIRLASPDGSMVFLSVASLDSDFGDGYAPVDYSIIDRFDYLSPIQRERSGIDQKICLYTPADVEMMLTACGYLPMWIQENPDGTIRAVAVKNRTRDIFTGE